MEMREGSPWEFSPDDGELKRIKSMPKLQRRQHMLKTSTQWDIYSAVRCLDPHQRLSKTNPARAVRAFVADYDMKTDLEQVEKLVDQLPEKFRPQKIEVSLSDKIRLIWMFEREVNVVSNEHAHLFLARFAKIIGASTLLPGYDSASDKPQQIWTNGGEWYDYQDKPVSWQVLFGIITKVGENSKLFGASEIPIEKIADEVEKRWPNRWEGNFEIDATGIRFWDPQADNPTGCQVKPDGMLCFTGNVPFKSWAEIFGAQWVQSQEVLQLGEGAGDIYYDGKTYYELLAPEEKADPVWTPAQRCDIVTRLKTRGISDRTARGQTSSNLDRVLNYIQTQNRINGAAPLVNYPRGVVRAAGRRILNTCTLDHYCPATDVMRPDPEKHFPWIWKFLCNLFVPNPEAAAHPKEYFLAWLKRAFYSLQNYKRLMGQVIFLCGPAENGKTLLILRIVAPILGYRISNPYSSWVGETTFNDDLYNAFLWAINDEEAPKNEASRSRFIAKLKASVVNPTHTYSPKFMSRVSVDWVGRTAVSLNDDPGSIGVLPETNSTNMDKMSFFATKFPFEYFPPDVEDIIEKELPYFARWLLDVYEPPKAILTNSRMGVASYYDPKILAFSQQQSHAFNLVELIRTWADHSSFFAPDNEGMQKEYWIGTPTDLLAVFNAVDTMSALIRDWSAPKIAKSLTTLARIPNSGVEFDPSSSRIFKINRSITFIKDDHGEDTE
jgi:hypothetical protein